MKPRETYSTVFDLIVPDFLELEHAEVMSAERSAASKRDGKPKTSR